MPLAVFPWPPLTLAQSLLAALLSPPLTLAKPPLAVLSLPPLTLAPKAAIVFTSPATRPPEAAWVNLLPRPITKLCDPPRSPKRSGPLPSAAGSSS